MLDDEQKPVTVTIHGPASKTYKDADAEAQRRQLNRVKQAGDATAARDADGQDELDFLVAITVGFSANLSYPTEDGKEWGSVSDMARALYSDGGLGFIRQQIVKEANSWDSFMQGSQSS
ncbi:MAG: hypothetical protein AAFR88_04950 [Pseudomonadota bacterium]